MKFNTKKRIALLVVLLVSGINGLLLLNSAFNGSHGFNDKFDANEHSIKTASSPSKAWSKTWGGSGNDEGWGIANDSSGNAYVCGYTESFGAQGKDICLVKFNSTSVEPNYTWGGSGTDSGRGIAMDASGNAYVCGDTTSFGALGFDICLVKFNSTGVESSYTYGGNENDFGTGIALDSSGNAYICGNTESFGAGLSDMYLVKFNSAGGVEFNYTWGGNETDSGRGIVLDASGNAYVCGYTGSFGAQWKDMCLVKFNSTGVEWNTTWGGSAECYGHGIAMDASGNLYVCGRRHNFDAQGWDIFLVKFNSAGSVEWSSTWGGSGGEYGYGISLDSSGNAYVCGFTTSFGAQGRDICLVKFNSAGNVECYTTWGGSENEEGLGIALDSSGNAYICGYTESFGVQGKDICLVAFKFVGGSPPDYTLIIIIAVVSVVSIAGVVSAVFITKRKRAS